MYGNVYSMAIVLDHRSIALTETKISECQSTANLGFLSKASGVCDLFQAQVQLLKNIIASVKEES